MARSKLLVIALSAALAFTPIPVKAGNPVIPPILNSGNPGAGAYALMGCVAGIILAAIDASRRFNRQLTAEEAATCGLLYWINLANQKR